MTNIMLTSNNTPVYVIPTIIPHTPTPSVGGLAMLTDRAASSGVTFAFKVQRSSKTQYLNERRLMLGVTATGTIMWTSAGTPEALFGVSPQGIVGQGIASMVDVFEEYTSGNSGALAALYLACAFLALGMMCLLDWAFAQAFWAKACGHGGCVLGTSQVSAEASPGQLTYILKGIRPQ
jgi:hypothetical protein